MTAKYVSHHASASDANGGTDDTTDAWKTIQHGWDSIGAGDILYVKADEDYVYDDDTNPGSPDQTAHSASECLAIDTGASVSGGTVKQLVGYTTTPGDGGSFTIDGNDRDIPGINVIDPAENCWVKNIILENCGTAAGFLHTGGAGEKNGTICINVRSTSQAKGYQHSSGSGSLTLIACQADTCTAEGILGGSTGGPLLVVDCTVYGCGGAGNSLITLNGHRNFVLRSLLYDGGNNALGGIYSAGVYTYIDQCTIYDTAGILGGICSGGVVHALNTIMASNAVNMTQAYWGTLYASYCCSYNGGGADNYTDGGDNITSDPQFIDAANNDFRLKPTSPCLNTGRPTPESGYRDIGAWGRKSLLRIE